MTKHQSLCPATGSVAPLTPATVEAIASPEQASHASRLLPDDALAPVAARHDGWTPQRQRAFIEALADSGCVQRAAQTVGMSAASAYRLRRRTDARAFDAAWDAALERAIERLIPVAIERALHGSIRKRWYHGEVVAEEHVTSERLLVWLLEKGAAMLGHSHARRAMRADWDSALEGVGLPGSTPPEPDRPHRIWLNEEHDAYMTDAPPEPGYDEWRNGTPGQPGYARYLMIEEHDALEQSRQTPPLSPWQEAARRRSFGMDSATCYEPGYAAEDIDAPPAHIAQERAGAWAAGDWPLAESVATERPLTDRSVAQSGAHPHAALSSPPDASLPDHPAAARAAPCLPEPKPMNAAAPTTAAPPTFAAPAPDEASRSDRSGRNPSDALSESEALPEHAGPPSLQADLNVIAAEIDQLLAQAGAGRPAEAGRDAAGRDAAGRGGRRPPRRVK